MKLTVNGETRELPDKATVADLVADLRLGKAAVAVEVNRDLVPRKAHASTPLHEGDTIEVVTLVGGG
jgi:sulfur carrier protein